MDVTHLFLEALLYSLANLPIIYVGRISVKHWESPTFYPVIFLMGFFVFLILRCVQFMLTPDLGT